MGNYIGTTSVDTFVASGYNTFRFTPATLSAADTVDTGTGSGALYLQEGGTLAADALAGVRGVGTYNLSADGSGITFLDINAASIASKRLTVNTFDGDDIVDLSAITAAAGISVNVALADGDDRVFGSAGADVFRARGTSLDAGDTIAGGAGRDVLEVAGAVTFTGASLANISGLELIRASSGSVNATLDAAFLVRNPGVAIVLATGAFDNLVDARALTGAIFVTAGGGVDTLIGGAGNDRFTFTTAVDGDTVTGGGGRDTLLLGANTTTAGLANVSGVERLELNNNAAQVALPDSLVRSLGSERLLVTAASLTTSSFVDAGAVTANGIDFVSASFDSRFIGSGGNDTFTFPVVRLQGDAAIVGGAGYDTLLLQGAGVVSAAAFDNVRGIEQIDLGAGTYLTISNFAATRNAAMLSINGTADADYVDASQSVNAARAIFVTAGAGDDSLFGGKGADVFRFAAAQLSAADVVDGGTGTERDTLQLTGGGTVTADSLRYVTEIETIALGNATNLTLSDRLVSGSFTHGVRVYGSAGDDVVSAASVTSAGNYVVLSLGDGDDVLRGGAGRDYLNGGAGADRLTGGAGTDFFVFAAPLQAGVFDTITDFSAAQDTIQLDDAVFAGLSAGALPAAAFAMGASALQADDRIVYDPATGALLFDADGSGAGAAMQFAQLSSGLTLTAADFVVI